MPEPSAAKSKPKTSGSRAAKIVELYPLVELETTNVTLATERDTLVTTVTEKGKPH